MVASGDVLILTPNQIPEIPQADVVLFGLWVTQETAGNFGVMFCRRENPQELVTFLPGSSFRMRISGHEIKSIHLGGEQQYPPFMESGFL